MEELTNISVNIDVIISVNIYVKISPKNTKVIYKLLPCLRVQIYILLAFMACWLENENLHSNHHRSVLSPQQR
jgi:hypothetical protein